LGTLAKTTLVYPFYRVPKAPDGLSRDIGLVRKRLPFVLSRRLISRVRMPRRTRPSLALCVGEDMLKFSNTHLERLFKLFELLRR
jgi:hypothetical protein